MSQGVSCDMCRKFAQFAVSYGGMFGQPSQTMPAGWIIMTEERPPQQAMSGLLDVLSSSVPDPPKGPSIFCSRACARDYLTAVTLVDGPGAS